jgi:succinate dehydrogenase cytochrome b556 subunit
MQNQLLKVSVSTSQALNSISKRCMSTSNLAKNRPLSPHLAIYKFRINMNTSVLFRGTGVVLVGGIAGLSILNLINMKPLSYYLYHLQQYPALTAIVKFGIAFSLSYHYFGGMRHLVSSFMVESSYHLFMCFIDEIGLRNFVFIDL